MRYQQNERYNKKYWLFIDNLLKEQNNKCAICNDIFKIIRNNSFSTKYDYQVDHCHVTKEVRGLLCRSCNILVGEIENMRFGKKSLALLAKIGDYLYNHSL